VFAHICRFPSLFARTMCVISALQIELSLMVNDVALLRSSCFPRSRVSPKMSQSSLHYHIIRPPTAGFYSSQELSFLSPHTRGNALKPSGSGSGIYHYIHLEKGRFGVFLHMPDRLVTPLPGRVCDLILMTS